LKPPGGVRVVVPKSGRISPESCSTGGLFLCMVWRRLSALKHRIREKGRKRRKTRYVSQTKCWREDILFREGRGPRRSSLFTKSPQPCISGKIRYTCWRSSLPRPWDSFTPGWSSLQLFLDLVILVHGHACRDLVNSSKVNRFSIQMRPEMGILGKN